MSNTTTLRTNAEETSVDSLRKNVRPRLPLRRRWWLILASVLLIGGAVAGSLSLLAAVDEREPMLRLNRAVAWGETIDPDDVEPVSMPPQAREFAIPEHRETQILGKVATRRLHAGDLLSPQDAAQQTIPGPGQRVIGVRVEPGQSPARGLRSGDPVRVMPLASESSVDSYVEASPTEEAVSARVVGTSPPGSDGAVTVDVLVPTTRVESAERAAAGEALITLLGPDSTPGTGVGR